MGVYGGLLLAGVCLFAGVMAALAVRRVIRGGRAAISRARSEARLRRFDSNNLVLEAEANLPRAREDARRARMNGTLRRSAVSVLEMKESADASAKRSRQSFDAFDNRRAALLDRLGRAGWVAYRDGALVFLDRRSASPRKRRNAHQLYTALTSMEDARRACRESGVPSGETDPIGFTREDADRMNAALDDRGIDEKGLYRRVKANAEGGELLPRAEQTSDRRFRQAVHMNPGLPRRLDPATARRSRGAEKPRSPGTQSARRL
ncbi:hypothetical protein [Streptomonospora litoralis]|uniref:Uncharacterized protein n=1 Tax=Streptomonospora litoralis TaxID=2498135 RepID=A0A4P6Q9L9_9ACTN|nr:hypothetical protein [Streptomonospora litoralis]QBI56331.1 hypothetical protein EKD16_22890 [Streptomonospora litoralis]